MEYRITLTDRTPRLAYVQHGGRLPVAARFESILMRGGVVRWEEQRRRRIGSGRVHHMAISGLPGCSQRYLVSKRALDASLSLVAMVLMSPFFLMLLVVVAFDLGWPPLFLQTRPGLHGKPFTIIKFRTMTSEKGQDGQLLPDGLRMTRIGSLLRASSLDELPEVLNVLRGDMSLVGPRPLLMEYLPLYNPHQTRRHAVRPGITGLAQVSGRNVITWESKFDLDVYYVDHMSLGLDLKILLLTLWKVLKAEGISAQGHATVPLFRGSDASGKS